MTDPADIETLRARVSELEAVLAAQEQALNFETTCLGCGNALEIALCETGRADAAEARAAELETLITALRIPFPRP